ncbi:MAG: ATP-grasp domain-containing protein [Dehalococcoidia bacterium]|nr:ATP-grasp domain-containing protein [Dehalococcoidia bacterium]
MRIGLSFDLKEKIPLAQSQPEDALEEYDSRETVEAIARVLRDAGNSTLMLGGGRDFLVSILQEKVDLVFNIAEGRGNYKGREAQVPSILEMLDIPYVGSDPQCLSICLDKPLTKQLVEAAGIYTPRWQVINRENELKKLSWDDFPFPVFVKPAYEGSSKGIRTGSRADNVEQMASLVTRLLEGYQQPALVEEFIPGDEITVGIIGNASPKVLGIMRVIPRKEGEFFVYSLEVKRDWENLVEYECPAKLKPEILSKIRESALKIFEVLGCRDFARMDFRLRKDGKPYFLEINPLPGLNPHSGDLPIMSGKAGISYNELISAIFNAALERYPGIHAW